MSFFLSMMKEHEKYLHKVRHKEVLQPLNVLVVRLSDLSKTIFRQLSFACAINPLIDQHIRYLSLIELIQKIFC